MHHEGFKMKDQPDDFSELYVSLFVPFVLFNLPRSPATYPQVLFLGLHHYHHLMLFKARYYSDVQSKGVSLARRETLISMSGMYVSTCDLCFILSK